MFYIYILKSKIDNKLYIPDPTHLLYDGRMEHQRFLFLRYRDKGEYLNLLYLWGTEEAYRHINNINYSKEYCNKGSHIVNDKSPWCWWHLKDT